MSEDICSNCGRDMSRRWHCKKCGRELLCGEVSVPCPEEGCAELRMADVYHERDRNTHMNLVEPRGK